MTIFERTAEEIKRYGLSVASSEFDRLYGGFFVIEEEQSQKFAEIDFKGLNVKSLKYLGN